MLDGTAGETRKFSGGRSGKNNTLTHTLDAQPASNHQDKIACLHLEVLYTPISATATEISFGLPRGWAAYTALSVSYNLPCKAQPTSLGTLCATRLVYS